MKTLTLGKLFSFAIILIVVLFVALESVYIIDQREKAIKIQFGRVVQSDIEAGLHFKIPFIQTIMRFDGRLQTFDLPEENYISSEQKRLIVDSYFMWKIDAPLRFFTATQGDERRATALLSQRIDSILRNKFGSRTITELISGDRDALIKSLTEDINNFSSKELGIEVLDSRIKRVDFSQEISESVFKRMRSDREQEARNIRAKGRQTAIELQAEADKQATLILASAKKKAEILQGEGEGDAARTLRNAFDKNPRYYRLYQKIKTMQLGLNRPTDILIINPNSDFLKATK